MRLKLCLFIVLLISFSANVYSSGALRFVLPYLSTLGGSLKEGELAYDSLKKAIVYKNDSEIVALANNIDKTPVFSIPVIDSYVGISTGSNPVYVAHVDAGKVRIGNITYVNSEYTKCVHDTTDVQIGLDHFDGSTSSIVPAAGYFKPIYLYLVGSSAGFKCIFSYNSNGLASPYNSSRWLRVASLVGKTGESRFRTSENFTKSYFTYLNITTPAVFDLDYLILPSMKLVKFGEVSCPAANQEFYIMERFTYGNSEMEEEPTTYTEFILSCWYGEPKTAAFEYFPRGSSEFVTNGTNNPVKLTFNGWQEIPLSAL